MVFTLKKIENKKHWLIRNISTSKKTNGNTHKSFKDRNI